MTFSTILIKPTTQLLFVSLFFNSILFGQLRADFTIDKTGGCSPLPVAFTNTTTGASSTAIYKWDLGNGNTSSLFSAGATYSDEKTYTIILSVSDGGQTSSKTQQITVYKKPSVEFSPSKVKGCIPLTVDFISTSKAGDGTISKYFWDFGDGATEQTTAASFSHTYNFEQKAPVSLTVTNSYGCYNTLQKPDLIEVFPVIKAGFTANKTFLCKTSDPVTFTNTSTATNDLTYNWNFGDGKTSTEKSPSYVYNQKGVFTVKLTVTNSAGCSDTSERKEYINVANFKTNFEISPLICQNSNTLLKSTSTPNPDLSTWTIGNSSYSGQSINYSFPNAGTHTVKLSNTYGSCVESTSKNVTVKSSPKLNGFIFKIDNACGAPATVNFKDTSADAEKWFWNFNYPSTNTTATIKEPSYTYDKESNYTVALTIFNAEGCSTTFTKPLIIKKPNISINIVTSNSPGYYYGCPGLKIKFGATPADEISTYDWDLGDGSKSDVAQPEHTYNNPGTYTVKLSYTTTAGCKNVVTYFNYIVVYKKPEVDFTSLSGTTICGNTPVTFSGTSTTGNEIASWRWTFGDNSFPSYGKTVTHQFFKDTVFTITLIASNGGCSDTVIKKDYITILPPFPKIGGSINTCTGNRGTVTFLQSSKKAVEGTWSFGDGTTAAFDPNKPSINHDYTKSGTYKVVLTATNGQCTVKDSITALVLLKQKPILTSSKSEICFSDRLDIKITNLDTNPYPYYYYSPYSISEIKYGDNTNFTGNITSTDPNWRTIYTGNLNGLQNGKKDLKVILSSTYFGCTDTTNLIPIAVRGPVADFKIISNNVCYKSPIVFDDNSRGTNNVPIKSWEWTFGDGVTKTLNDNNNVSYSYNTPGQYYVSLKVTDSEGCSASTASFSKVAEVNGPKAAFKYSPSNISPNTTVQFSNHSINYGNYSTEYKWIFPGGLTSTAYNSSFTFKEPGIDTVKLIAKNRVTGCTDTAVQLINVKNVNASFTYSTSYINNNSCPPVIVKFTNTSTNATKISWDFGDGSRADNQNSPSHTYYKPGEYNVTIYVNGANGAIDSSVTPITIKGPYAKLKANTYYGCLSQSVTLTAEVKNAVSYTWDFGDGSIKDTKDTFATHQYLTAGIYTPSLILKDNGGCSGISEVSEKIVIDSLRIAIPKPSGHFCDSTLVFFNPQIESLAAERLNQPLKYNWNFGTGNAKDTSADGSPHFSFNSPGKYTVSLKVISPYGCIKETSETIEVFKKAKAKIIGPSEICAAATASFTATTDVNANLHWKWTFNNGNTADVQNPEVQTYNDSGTYKVSVIVDNNGCLDTTTNALIVRPKPTINVIPKETIICLGKSIQLNAGGGIAFSWRADAGLNNYTVANPVASPAKSTTYKVEVTNAFGCKNTDSTAVNVAFPFDVQIAPEAFVCEGNDVQLTASGAVSYKWINNTSGITNTEIANPIVRPLTTTTYTVVGYDANNCFTDTGLVKVNVAARPTINAGPDLEILSGSTVQPKITSSSNVVKWLWSPADYLSCTNCPSPAIAPRSDIAYVVTGTTQYGCTASDTLHIKLLCNKGYVFIPTAFTPNGDYKNDLFYIKGRGVKQINFIKIYNRFGEEIFEKKNFQIDDPSSAWNGKYKGKDSGTGAYVYFTELLCDNGETFSFKGTVVLVR